MKSEKEKRVMEVFCTVVNRTKRRDLVPERVAAELYLGGDLGIDSVEMLGIWFDIENALAVQIDDSEKRDIYTVGEAIRVAASKL